MIHRASSPLESAQLLKQELKQACDGARSLDELERIRVAWLGRKGKITHLLKQLGSLPVDERAAAGSAINTLKVEAQNEIEASKNRLHHQALNERLSAHSVDVTLPSRRHHQGSLHPVIQTLNRFESIFKRLGFDTVRGPEIDDEWHNFDALNFPKDHPSRAMHDTFYLEGRLLRTHTSNVQIRYMLEHEPPLAIYSPGKVYRRDSDHTHTPMFHQIEALCVGQEIGFPDLKGVLQQLIEGFFGFKAVLRFRSSFFPFTEPSAEVDIQCIFCSGQGCRVCKRSGWLEVLGSGLVHPTVLKNCNIDPERYSGYAFGLGVERFAMLRHGIDDIRLLFQNDFSFLEQF